MLKATAITSTQTPRKIHICVHQTLVWTIHEQITTVTATLLAHSADICVVVWSTPLRVHFLNVQCNCLTGGISRGASAKLRSVGLLCDVQRRFLLRACTAKTHVVKDTGESHAAVAGGKLAPSAVGGGGFSGLSVGTMRRSVHLGCSVSVFFSTFKLASPRHVGATQKAWGDSLMLTCNQCTRGHNMHWRMPPMFLGHPIALGLSFLVTLRPNPRCSLYTVSPLIWVPAQLSCRRRECQVGLVGGRWRRLQWNFGSNDGT